MWHEFGIGYPMSDVVAVDIHQQYIHIYVYMNAPVEMSADWARP